MKEGSQNTRSPSNPSVFTGGGIEMVFAWKSLMFGSKSRQAKKGQRLSRSYAFLGVI